jgi:hypothetical protein
MDVEHEKFVQWTTQSKTYGIDFEDIAGDHLPLLSKPNWTMEHRAEDPNVLQGLATIETSADGGEGGRRDRGPDRDRDRPRLIVRGYASSKTFVIAVKRHAPITTRAPTFRVTQSRNGSIHH